MPFPSDDETPPVTKMYLTGEVFVSTVHDFQAAKVADSNNRSTIFLLHLVNS